MSQKLQYTQYIDTLIERSLISMYSGQTSSPSIATNMAIPSSKLVVSMQLSKAATSLQQPAYSGPMVTAIMRFHCTNFCDLYAKMVQGQQILMLHSA